MTMRVLIVTRSIPLHEHAGGMEKISWQIATGLRDAGCDVAVLTTRVPDRARTFEEDGIVVRTVASSRPGRYSIWWWIATALQSTADYSGVFSVSVGAASMILLRRPSTRYVMHVHGTARRELQGVIRGRGRLWVLKALRLAYWVAIDTVLYARADAVIAASEYVDQGLRETPYPVAWRLAQPVVVTNGVDTEKFQSAWESRARNRKQWGLAEHQKVVLSVGRLTLQKGADRLVPVMALLPSSTSLLIVGSGPEQGRLSALAQNVGGGRRVVLTGGVSADHVSQLMSASDVLVFSSRNAEREGLPLVVIEALASGLEVIVPLGSKWPAALVDFLVFIDLDDPRAVAEAIRCVPLVGGLERPARLPPGFDISDTCRSVLDQLKE